MPEEKMSKQEVEIKFPGTKPFDVDKATSEIVKGYQKIADGNIEKLQEIQKNAFPPIISEKVQKKIAKTVKAVIAAGIVASPFVLAACAKEVPVVEEKQNEEKGQVTIPSETIETTIPSTTAAETTPPTTQTTPETTAEIIINAPVIKDWEFHKDNSTFTNKEGETVAILVEKAYKQGGEWQSGIGITPGALRAINEENKKKGLFMTAWPIDFQENKNIEIVELVSANGGYKYIGLKYEKPINLYATFDCLNGYIFKYIPQKNDSFSSQDFSGSYFSSGFEVKNRNGDIVPADYEVEAVDLKPLVTLSQPLLSGRWEIQYFLEEIKIGQLVGQLLPANPNDSFLDFRDRSDWYENPDHCQASFWMNIFGDNLDVKSDSDMILRLGERDNRITAFVWSNNPKMS